VQRLTVSFCIPTHGRSRLLLEALESALTQTRLPDEIVVSDDLGEFTDSHAAVWKILIPRYFKKGNRRAALITALAPFFHPHRINQRCFGSSRELIT